MSTFEYSQLSNEAKKVAFANFKKKSIVLERNKHSLKKSNNPDGLIESYLLYSDYTTHERFSKNGEYLGLFNIHEEDVSF